MSHVPKFNQHASNVKTGNCSQISDQEKSVVRSALLQSIEEPVPQVLSAYIYIYSVPCSQNFHWTRNSPSQGLIELP